MNDDVLLLSQFRYSLHFFTFYVLSLETHCANAGSSSAKVDDELIRFKQLLRGRKDIDKRSPAPEHRACFPIWPTLRLLSPVCILSRLVPALQLCPVQLSRSKLSGDDHSVVKIWARRNIYKLKPHSICIWLFIER